MNVILQNKNGLIKTVKVGVSWTAFFFGFMPFFFRGMPGSGVGWFIIALLTLGLSNIYLFFRINKMTAIYYMEHGYFPTGRNWGDACYIWGIDNPEQIDVVG